MELPEFDQGRNCPPVSFLAKRVRDAAPKTKDHVCVFFFGFSQKAFMGLKEGVGDKKINKNYLLLCWRRLCLEFSFSL